MIVPKIANVRATPVALQDPPLLNTWGLHEPYALRIIVEVTTDSGITGLGECQGGSAALQRLLHVAPRLVGQRVDDAVGNEQIVRNSFHGLGERAVLTIASPFEVACLDAEAQYREASVAELLGGVHRQSVDFAGYLFYKWAGHPDAANATSPDRWGEAIDAEGVVRQAQQLFDQYGFRSWKLKGGVYAPEIELETVRALHDAFPDAPLRWDPNCAWTVETSLNMVEASTGILEYLEDPVGDLEEMAQVRQAGMPLASNMLIAEQEQFDEADAMRAADVLLVDHHYWGGMRRAVGAAKKAQRRGWGVSLHSNSHVGISLAAMAQVAAAIPGALHASDTHYPWTVDDDVIVERGTLLVDGAVQVPTGKGLGVTLDQEALAIGHERYLRAGQMRRNDTGYMRRFHPEFSPVLPRW